MTDLTTDPNAAAPVEEDAAALWAAFDEAEGTPAGVVAADEPEDDGATEPVADEPEAGADDGASTDVDTTTDADPADDTPAAPADDRWASAPEDMRAEMARLTAENAKLAQKERSATGRATGFQRRYEELAKAAQPRRQEGDRPSPDAAIASIAEDFPEIAKPLSEALKAVTGDVEQLTAAEEGRRQAAEQELSDYLAEEERTLLAAHPDYLEVLGSNLEQLMSWIDDQPRVMRDAFERNKNTIVDAAQAASVIGAFKAHIATPATAPAAAPTLSDKRQRQLGATASIGRPSRRPTVSGIPENGDPEQIWKAFDELESRR